MKDMKNMKKDSGYKTLQAIHQSLHIEIHEKSLFDPCQLHVGQ